MIMFKIYFKNVKNSVKIVHFTTHVISKQKNKI